MGKCVSSLFFCQTSKLLLERIDQTCVGFDQYKLTNKLYLLEQMEAINYCQTDKVKCILKHTFIKCRCNMAITPEPKKWRLMYTNK